MTTPTTNSSSPASGTAQLPANSGELDIRQVISGSTDDVPVSELSRKGFKQVKVLKQAVITKLITEAVDRVIAARTKKVGAEEREKVIQESKIQFEVLARERLQRERDRITELERANQSLLQETEELRNRLLEREKEINQLKEKGSEEGKISDRFAEALLQKLSGMGGGGDLSVLQNSIQEIAKKLDRLPARGGLGAAIIPGDEKAMIDALFRLGDTEAPDSNIAKVKVKEAKAGGVKETLAKLKSMQKGGHDGD